MLFLQNDALPDPAKGAPLVLPPGLFTTALSDEEAMLGRFVPWGERCLMLANGG
ncbi:hypothetical protein [Pseudorhodobacter ferrugineus]|uniref:hypothetical protein n=1 Tax=Pseudorhodobacter ferrugineus TaxID=77008 RepID=UPI0003B74039|nr:hypothetical protein [Pseudorhodobacter ferrugineus]